MFDCYADRKPIDPPPIVQLKISDTVDPSQNFLQSKDTIMMLWIGVATY